MLARVIRRFVADQDGATAMEYALMATLIGIALVATFSVVGDSVANMFGSGSDGAVGAINNQMDKLD